MELFSPSKINLFLHVTGKRPDGYHTLNTLMVRLAFGDTIRLDDSGKGVSVSCSHPDVPENEDNIAVKAAIRFMAALNVSDSVHIDIQKKIPVGAGLGGGSSNAATVLMGLNRLYGDPFTKKKLMDIGLTIGADVPFFIFGNTAFAEGVGEKLRMCGSVAQQTVLLVYPGLLVSTGEVYKKLNFGLTKDEKINKNHFFHLSKGRFCAKKHLWNDLEQATFNMYPEISRLKEHIASLGADGALMSGSGSTVFGLFSDKKCAEAAYKEMNSEIHKEADNRRQVILTEFLL